MKLAPVLSLKFILPNALCLNKCVTEFYLCNFCCRIIHLLLLKINNIFQNFYMESAIFGLTLLFLLSVCTGSPQNSGKIYLYAFFPGIIVLLTTSFGISIWFGLAHCLQMKLIYLCLRTFLVVLGII